MTRDSADPRRGAGPTGRRRQGCDTITYTDLYGDRYLAHARASGDLGNISLLEHMAGQPLLSVVAVSKTTGQPSHGLFELAVLHDHGKTECKCGVPLVAPGEDGPAFVARQCRLVRLAWTPPDPFGGPFRPLPGRGPANPPMELRIDLDALEKGTQRHEATRKGLADFIAANGGEPREPGKAAPFDLGRRTIVEAVGRGTVTDGSRSLGSPGMIEFGLSVMVRNDTMLPSWAGHDDCQPPLPH